MYFTLGKIPYEPGINGTKSKFSSFSSLSYAFNVIKNPFYLGSTEVCIRKETCLDTYLVSYRILLN